MTFTTLMNKIKADVVEQDRIIALKNCFHSWSGEIDEEVILQGILDRYEAMGVELKGGLKIVRRNLNGWEITTPEYVIVRRYATGRTHWENILYFHRAERLLLEDWMNENAHHLHH